MDKAIEILKSLVCDRPNLLCFALHMSQCYLARREGRAAPAPKVLTTPLTCQSLQQASEPSAHGHRVSAKLKFIHEQIAKEKHGRGLTTTLDVLVSVSSICRCGRCGVTAGTKPRTRPTGRLHNDVPNQISRPGPVRLPHRRTACPIGWNGFEAPWGTAVTTP